MASIKKESVAYEGECEPVFSSNALQGSLLGVSWRKTLANNIDAVATSSKHSTVLPLLC